MSLPYEPQRHSVTEVIKDSKSLCVSVSLWPVGVKAA